MPVNKSTKIATPITEFNFSKVGVGEIPDKILLAMQGAAVVWVALGDSESELLAAARVRFPTMIQNKNSPAIAQAIQRLQNLLDQPTSIWDAPLDLQGTEFQKLVWSAIAKISVGTTMTYQQLAISIGRKSSVRAVASACGANPVAIVVPCHRVLRSDGGLGGYRWGLQRKKALLALEAKPQPTLF